LIPGVDAGLFKMKPGEVRQLELPPPLAYGARGSRLYEIPPNTNLYWTVQMVRVNSRSEGDAPETD
jgi:FKBP-type peptidyl-prolyl cis-trans isomerase